MAVYKRSGSPYPLRAVGVESGTITVHAVRTGALDTTRNRQFGTTITYYKCRLRVQMAREALLEQAGSEAPTSAFWANARFYTHLQAHQRRNSAETNGLVIVHRVEDGGYDSNILGLRPRLIPLESMCLILPHAPLARESYFERGKSESFESSRKNGRGYAAPHSGKVEA